MKKFYVFLAVLFMMNGAMPQGSFPALSIKILSQSKHPASGFIENAQDGRHNQGMKTSRLNSEMNVGNIQQCQTHLPQDLIQLFDSVYDWQWDTLTTGWIISNKVTNIVYDGKHNMTSYIEQFWNGSAWVNSGKDTLTYDASNNETSYLYQMWNGAGWVNYSKSTYTYDVNNNETGNLSQTWSGSDWVNYSKYTYTYDAKNNRTSRTRQIWDGSSWVNSSNYVNTYDANDNMTNSLYSSWNGSDWVYTFQYTYSYDAKNNQTGYLYQSWNGSSWENSVQATNTYDANNNLTKELIQTWNGIIWENAGQISLTYDANNNQTSELFQNWDGSNWVNVWQYTSTYDVNNFEQSYTYKDWNAAGTKIESGDSSYSFYHTVLGINDVVAQHGNLTVYPNPASAQITIETSAITSQGQLSISNLNGQQLITRRITQPRTQVDISGLPGGLYFVSLTTDSSMARVKFIKQ